jgi:sulfite oxidase
VRVEELVDEPLDLTLEDLHDGRFPPVAVTATIQCAGNRRADMAAVREISGEDPWVRRPPARASGPG